jgi:UDP-2,4-diacetamido-2,4,6-trideoxy-beta-L-altropyranose hydrolase
MNILFYVDTKESSGRGHLSRCVSLALELKKTFDIKFCISEKKQAVLDYLSDYGFYKVGGYDDRSKCAVLIVDDYHFSESLRAAIMAASRKIVVFEPRPQYNFKVDLAVFPGFISQEKACFDNFLCGEKYALLDKKFLNGTQKNITNVKRITVSFGCIDSHNMAMRSVLAIKKLFSKYPNILITALVSSSSCGYAEWKNIANERIRILIDRESIVDVLKGSDLVIGSAGVSLLERMALGIPSLTISTHPDQEVIVKYFSDKGATFNLGYFNMLSVELLSNAIDSYLNKENGFYDKMSKIALSLFDGKGAIRIKNKIYSMVKGGACVSH